MPILTIVLTLILVGVALWVINTYIPMAQSVKKILNVVIVVVLCIWLLQVFGIIGNVKHLTIQ
jgi:hypothetical protein